VIFGVLSPYPDRLSRIRQAREAHGLTWSALARAAGAPLRGLRLHKEVRRSRSGTNKFDKKGGS